METEQTTDETAAAQPDGAPDPDARLAEEITEIMPPVLAGVITGFEALVIPFPLWTSGKALELRSFCGPFVARLRVDPEFGEAICEEIMKAVRSARSGITPAAMTDVDAVAEQAGKLQPR